jgi:hypothetical protein
MDAARRRGRGIPSRSGFDFHFIQFSYEARKRLLPLCQGM